MVHWVTVVGALVAQGCLLTDPPPYEAPEKTRPFLTPVTPPVTQVFTVVDPGLYEFRAEVRSEDASDRVASWLFIDYTTEDEQWTDRLSIDPSTLDAPCPEVGDCRPLSLWWAGDSPDGCHTVTLLATHEANVKDQRDCRRPSIPCFHGMEDVSTVTWWAEVRRNGGTPPATLDSCPTPATLTADEGAP